MLILTRRSNERIFIGDNVALVVLGIENNRVKLGIEAPADVTILREEIVNDADKIKFDTKNQSNIADDKLADIKTGT